MRFVFCQVEVSATGRSLVQRSSTECGMSEYDQVQQSTSTAKTIRQKGVSLRRKGRKKDLFVLLVINNSRAKHRMDLSAHCLYAKDLC